MEKEQDLDEVKEEILNFIGNEIKDSTIDTHYSMIVFPWKDKYHARIIVEVEKI